MTSDHEHSSGQHGDAAHEHSHLDAIELRVRALKTLLSSKGYIDPEALDVIVGHLRAQNWTTKRCTNCGKSVDRSRL